MKFKFPIEAKALLTSLLDNIDKQDRAKLIIQHSAAPEEVKSAFYDALETEGEDSMKLADALKVEGMSEYLQSVKDEVSKSFEDKITLLDTQITDFKAKVEAQDVQIVDLTEKAKVAEDAKTAEKTMLIDQIADLSLALRDESIDLEKVDSSIEELKTSLKDTKVEDLKAKYSELRDTLAKTFTNVPGEPIGDPTDKDDPTKQTKVEPIVIHTLDDMASAMFHSKNSDDK